MPWFTKKKGNRRLGREHVLDVKLRSSKVRAARVRMVAAALGSCFALVLGGYLVWYLTVWLLHQCIYDNQAFAIRDIEVQTDGIISVDHLRRWTGVRARENLMALDLAQVERNLKLVTLVDSVAIERVPLHTLRIRVFERVPIAQINVPRPKPGGGVDFMNLQIDPHGYVILPLEPQYKAVPHGQPLEQLPVIFGVNPNDAQPGRRLESAQVQAALQLTLAFERSAMYGLTDLKRIDITGPDVLVATTAQENEITFGLEGHDRQLARWREIFEAAQKAGKQVSSLDLAVTNSIPLRWVDAAPAAGPMPEKPPKRPKTRKKHV